MLQPSFSRVVSVASEDKQRWRLTGARCLRRMGRSARRFGRVAGELVVFLGLGGALVAGALMLR